MYKSAEILQINYIPGPCTKATESQKEHLAKVNLKHVQKAADLHKQQKQNLEASSRPNIWGD